MHHLLNLLIWLLGAFRAYKKRGIGKSLLVPVKILENKGCVIMFPEGRIIIQRPKLGEGKRGAAILALTTRSTILPISLHTPAHMTLLKFLFSRPKIVINIGEQITLNPLEYPNFSDKYTYKATQVLMKEIGKLYYSHEY